MRVDKEQRRLVEVHPLNEPKSSKSKSGAHSHIPDLGGPMTMSSGRELVVVKQEIVQREYEKLGLKLSRCSRSSYVGGGSQAAHNAGYAAGDGATFGRPVGGGRWKQVAT